VWCDAAGLSKQCSAHGLRKAACRRLAEAGCSASEIAAISGHATLGEVQRYTKAADQARMARAAMERQQAAARNDPATFAVKPDPAEMSNCRENKHLDDEKRTRQVRRV
jgi:Phage integrase family